MPFSDDEQIVTKKKSKFKTVILILVVVLFVISLLNDSYCTTQGCRTGLDAFISGAFAALSGGAALSWLANPFLFIAWVLLLKNRKSAWIFGLAASIISLYFLRFNYVIEDEAGHYNMIVKITLGYWLWLSSCIVIFIGGLVLKFTNRHFIN
jgi:hypothetical protein